MKDPALWSRLSAFPLDDPKAERPYTAKLADEAGWSAKDAARVTEEYRRFLYLAQVMNRPPAPPDPIETAWRTHLLYTRAYLEDLVPNVLQAPFHRDPGVIADHRARKAFWKTAKHAYEAEFGTPPPADIWPNPGALTMGGTIATLMILGIFGGLLTFLVMFLLGWILGIPAGGPVDTPFEKAFTAIFLLCWVTAFFSPLWAWLMTRGQKRLKSRNRPKPGSISFGIGIGYGRS